MKEIKKVVVVGLGAIGSAYASNILQAAPESLLVVADEERANRLRHGVVVNGANFHFPLVSPKGEADVADLVLLSVKYHQLRQAISDMKRFVGPHTVILSLLNGISSEEILARTYGWEKILYGLCVGIDAVRENGTVRYSNAGKIMFGEKQNREISLRVAAVSAFFDDCGIHYEVPEDMLRALWWKFMANVGINQMSGVLRATYGVFQKIPEAEALMRSAMREVITLAQAMNINLTEEDINDFIRFLNTLSPAGKTSMLQDVEAGRQTEVDMFAGEVCRLGSEYRVQTPVNAMLLQMLHTIEEMHIS